MGSSLTLYILIYSANTFIFRRRFLLTFSLYLYSVFFVVVVSAPAVPRHCISLRLLLLLEGFHVYRILVRFGRRYIISSPLIPLSYLSYCLNSFLSHGFSSSAFVVRWSPHTSPATARRTHSANIFCCCFSFPPYFIIRLRYFRPLFFRRLGVVAHYKIYLQNMHFICLQYK